MFLGACTVVGFLLERHRKSAKAEAEAAIKELLTEPLGKMEESLHRLDVRMSVTESRMDDFHEDLKLAMIKILHHPEKSRRRVDELLDKLRENTLEEGEPGELREYLEYIRDWEPGDKSDFRIFDGEQVAAALLLHVMDQDAKRSEGKRGR